MRRKFSSIILLIVLLLLAGCGLFDDNVYNADFQGAILEVRESSIIVAEDDIDPEASYPTYEVFIDDQTMFSGEVEKFVDLDKIVNHTNHPIVHLWVMDKEERGELDNSVASEVIVGEE